MRMIEGYIYIVCIYITKRVVEKRTKGNRIRIVERQEGERVSSRNRSRSCSSLERREKLTTKEFENANGPSKISFDINFG